MTKGASYLERPNFSLTAKDLATWGPPAFAIMTLAAIGLVYLVLIGAYLAMKVEHQRLDGFRPAVEAEAPYILNRPEVAGNDPSDSYGAKHITFSGGSQKHYFRNNDQTGRLLVIAGMVRNSYPEPREFIRLRGHILANDGTSLADRFVYAGNVISEDELRTLPYAKILERLSTRPEQNGKNMNIAPGAEAPFMIVFGKLPEGMSEYRVDPVGSSPAR